MVGPCSDATGASCRDGASVNGASDKSIATLPPWSRYWQEFVSRLDRRGATVLHRKWPCGQIERRRNAAGLIGWRPVSAHIAKPQPATMLMPAKYDCGGLEAAAFGEHIAGPDREGIGHENNCAFVPTCVAGARDVRRRPQTPGEEQRQAGQPRRCRRDVQTGAKERLHGSNFSMSAPHPTEPTPPLLFVPPHASAAASACTIAFGSGRIGGSVRLRPAACSASTRSLYGESRKYWSAMIATVRRLPWSVA
jgi:hypothetical protein